MFGATQDRLPGVIVSRIMDSAIHKYVLTLPPASFALRMQIWITLSITQGAERGRWSQRHEPKETVTTTRSGRPRLAREAERLGLSRDGLVLFRGPQDDARGRRASPTQRAHASATATSSRCPRLSSCRDHCKAVAARPAPARQIHASAAGEGTQASVAASRRNKRQVFLAICL